MIIQYIDLLKNLIPNNTLLGLYYSTPTNYQQPSTMSTLTPLPVCK